MRSLLLPLVVAASYPAGSGRGRVGSAVAEAATAPWILDRNRVAGEGLPLSLER